jgi:prevent-host-death family protein
MYHMKKATVRDLRYDFKKIERALRAGEEIEITKRGRKIARLVPDQERPPLPDFMARLREMFGDKQLEVSGAELISQEREGR